MFCFFTKNKIKRIKGDNKQLSSHFRGSENQTKLFRTHKVSLTFPTFLRGAAQWPQRELQLAWLRYLRRFQLIDIFYCYISCTSLSGCRNLANIVMQGSLACFQIPIRTQFVIWSSHDSDIRKRDDLIIDVWLQSCLNCVKDDGGRRSRDSSDL